MRDVGIDMNSAILMLLILVLALSGCDFNRISSASDLGASSRSANSNDVATVQAEIDSATFRATLARAAGVWKWRLPQFTMKVELGIDSIIPSWHSKPGASDRLADVFMQYLHARAEGHSAQYCIDLITPNKIIQPQYRKVLEEISEYQGPHFFEYMSKRRCTIGARWVHRVLPQPDNWVIVDILDGDLAWSYELRYRPDGSLDYCICTRRDAVEFNPAYTNIIAEVEASVTRQLKEEGAAVGDFSTFGRFIMLKQAQLRERGVNWRSEVDLNDRAY